MELMKWTPTMDLFNAHSRFNSLWDQFFASGPTSASRESLWNWNPAVDVYENDDAIVVKAELPGVDKDKIAVDIQGRTLTLKGERSSENEVKEENYYRKERVHGRFERSFALPADVDPDSVKAQFKDGVLTIEVPKPEDRKPKQITVH